MREALPEAPDPVFEPKVAASTHFGDERCRGPPEFKQTFFFRESFPRRKRKDEMVSPRPLNSAL